MQNRTGGRENCEAEAGLNKVVSVCLRFVDINALEQVSPAASLPVLLYHPFSEMSHMTGGQDKTTV